MCPGGGDRKKKKKSKGRDIRVESPSPTNASTSCSPDDNLSVQKTESNMNAFPLSGHTILCSVSSKTDNHQRYKSHYDKVKSELTKMKSTLSKSDSLSIDKIGSSYHHSAKSDTKGKPKSTIESEIESNLSYLSQIESSQIDEPRSSISQIQSGSTISGWTSTLSHYSEQSSAISSEEPKVKPSSKIKSTSTKPTVSPPPPKITTEQIKPQSKGSPRAKGGAGTSVIESNNNNNKSLTGPPIPKVTNRIIDPKTGKELRGNGGSDIHKTSDSISDEPKSSEGFQRQPSSDE